SVEEPAGFTEQIRRVLEQTQVPLTTTQIKDYLKARGVKASSSRNLLINLHVILRRFDRKGILDKSEANGKILYRLKPDQVRKRAFSEALTKRRLSVPKGSEPAKTTEDK